MENYYYNETEKSFAVATNFKYNPIPTGFREVTKEDYDKLQEEVNNIVSDNIKEQ